MTWMGHFFFAIVGWVDRCEHRAPQNLKKILWVIYVQHQYADEQLATVQKRICLIEFLRLRLIIVYQGAPTPTTKNC